MATERAGSGAARSLVRSQELLWQRTGPRSRGPKPGLTIDQIVDMAIETADADGIDAVSMRRLARELGVGTMSLYRYVPGKEELLALMLDRVSADTVLPPEEGAGWREALAAIARTTYQMYLAHPWLLKVNWTRPVFGPNTLAGVESFIAALDRLGLTSQQRVMVMMMIDSFVTGMVRTHVLYATAAEETGLSDDEFWKLQLPILERAMATGNYPAMAALSEDAFDASWDETFEFGLARLLDGIEQFVAGRQRQ